MRGIVIGVLLIAAGVALVLHGSLSFDAAREQQQELLFGSVVSPAALAASVSSATTSTPSTSITSDTSTNDARTQAFLSSASFAIAMDAPVYTSFYLFNITNSAQVLSGTAPPRMHQVGPYVYEKRSRKVNVELEPSPSPSPTIGTVSYQVESTYVFVPMRSNGSESDTVVTLNATYARRLSKLRARGYSERLLLAEYAQQHMAEYAQHLRHAFLADTKLRAWRHFLPALVQHVTHEALPVAIAQQQQRVDAASIPANLVRMFAVARTEMIPCVLRDVYKDISDQYVPELLASALATAQRAALPRVLSNAQQRLLVETSPFWLQQQLASQQMRHVPRTLASLSTKIASIAFPYVVREVYDRACLDAVPSLLRTIKREIVVRDIAINRATADAAQRRVVEIWRQQSSVPTDFDAWIDDAPTGTARTGFELEPSSSSLELSIEAATLLLGSKVSNTRFSIVDYDAAAAAQSPLDAPLSTPEGFGIWKQVIAMNETAIAYVLEGVNMDVANVADFLTRDQLLYVRAYLVRCATSTVTQRDRERLWRQGFTKRTPSSDQIEASVDLDSERVGVQTGFTLQPTGASASGVPAAVAQTLWDPLSAFAVVNPQGFTKWQSAIRRDTGAAQLLLDGVPGLTAAHIAEVSAWIEQLLTDGFVQRRALRHWSDGTCNSALGVPLTTCTLYDLEPSIDGIQTGFEMNPLSDRAVAVPLTVREQLWDRSSATSFLVATHPSTTTIGFGRWLYAIRTADYTRVAVDTGLTVSSAQAIAKWLANWTTNELNVLNVLNWWRRSTCYDREQLSMTGLATTMTAGLTTCIPTYTEVEDATATVLETEATASPFFTWTKAFAVVETLCERDAATALYTERTSTYDLAVRVYSCDALSTSLADDVDEQTFGFELQPTGPAASDRVSLAAAAVLWDASSAVSIVHTDGYRHWYAQPTLLDPTAAVDASMLAAINTAIDAKCASVVAGGVRSGVFNDTLSATARCGHMTAAQYTAVQLYVRSLGGRKWIRNALLDQWRRGSANVLELEPYRVGTQRGWELAAGCTARTCVLAQANGTVYSVPRVALELWDAGTHRASFLTVRGWQLWATLLNATASNDAQAIAAARSDLIAASQTTHWTDWMQLVLEWLGAWLASEHLLRDILGHWLYAQCPTTPRRIRVVERAPNVVSTVRACLTASQYEIALNESIADLQTKASRPTAYFASDVVETSARVQPTKVVEVVETWTTCGRAQGPNAGIVQVVVSQTSLMAFQACNVLSVLANLTINDLAATPTILMTGQPAKFAPLAVIPIDANFEMNRSSTPAALIAIDVALQLWNASTSFAFTNASAFTQLWLPALTHATALAALQRDVITATNTTASPSDLSSVQSYLTMWEQSTAAMRRASTAWLAQTATVLDLDADAAGIQSGFELFPSGEWKRLAGTGVMPTLEQAQYLWRADSTYSFLNTNGAVDSQSGLPTGFAAWQAVYDGVDYSSERLVEAVPTEARVTYDSMMYHALPADQRDALVLEMTAATGLTSAQLRGIAGWLLNWSNNAVLRSYVLHQWATGATLRGETGAVLDFANHVKQRFGFLTASSRLLPDRFTVASPLTATLSSTARQRLWDVARPGSLVNPTTSIVWCTIAAQASSYCPSILYASGAVSATAFALYKRVVQSTVPTSEITASSNLTKFAIAYVQRQLGIDDERAVVAVAAWWRALPTTSMFFQLMQLRQWRASDATSPSLDPLRFGYDLAFVFRSVVPRNATARDLVVNTVDVAGATGSLRDCQSENLELLFALWQPANAMSFLHPIGREHWRMYVHDAVNTTAFVQVIAMSDDVMTIDAVKAAGSVDDVACVLQAIRNWLASWLQHPFVRQLVESLWFEPLSTTMLTSTSALLLRSSTSELLHAFPLDATVAAGTTVRQSIESTDAVARERWANVSRTVLDTSLTVSFVDSSGHGAALWEALLVDCMSSDTATGACRNASMQSLATYKRDVAVANATLATLMQALQREMKMYEGATSSPTAATISTIAGLEAMVTTRILPWMFGWLDHPLFEAFVLDHARATLEPRSDALRMRDLAMAQFVNASATRASYAVPTILDRASVPIISSDGEVTAMVDAGTASERFARQQLVFDASTQVLQWINASTLAAFSELAAFCDLNAQDVVFAYDAPSHVCKLNVEYAIGLDTADALVTLLADAAAWHWPDVKPATGETTSTTSALPTTTRAALLIDAFLAQPFASKTECDGVMQPIAVAYALTPVQVEQACRTPDGGGIYLDLPMLAAAGFATKPRSYTADVQAYLRYTATKSVYEPQVLGRQPTAFVSQRAPASASDLAHPIGGFLAATTVSSVLFARTDATASSGLWRNGSDVHQVTGSRRPQVFTVQLPLVSDVTLFETKRHVVGEIVAIDHATTASIAGEHVPLSALRATDGSQFTTVIRASKAAATTSFPPTALLFYWDYAQRYVEAQFVRNVTRFGMPLMRYSVASWLEPATFPSGLADPTISMVNMSLLYDDLDLALSSASPVVAGDIPEISIDVDSLTGIVYHRRLVWQLNARLTRDASRDVWHRDMSDGWLPVVLVHEQASVSSSTGLALAAIATTGPFAREKVGMWQVVGGAVCIVVGVVLSIVVIRRQRLVRLRQMQSVLPEQTVMQLKADESTTLTASMSSSDTDVTSRHRLRSSSNSSSAEVAPLATSAGSSDPQHEQVRGSRSSRSRKRTQPGIQTIVEHTDGIGEDADTNTSHL